MSRWESRAVARGTLLSQLRQSQFRWLRTTGISKLVGLDLLRVEGKGEGQPVWQECVRQEVLAEPRVPPPFRITARVPVERLGKGHGRRRRRRRDPRVVAVNRDAVEHERKREVLLCVLVLT